MKSVFAKSKIVVPFLALTFAQFSFAGAIEDRVEAFEQTVKNATSILVEKGREAGEISIDFAKATIAKSVEEAYKASEAAKAEALVLEGDAKIVGQKTAEALRVYGDKLKANAERLAVATTQDANALLVFSGQELKDFAHELGYLAHATETTMAAVAHRTADLAELTAEKSLALSLAVYDNVSAEATYGWAVFKAGLSRIRSALGQDFSFLLGY